MIQITISTYGKNSYSTIITIGPSLSGLRGTQLAGSINYTLVTRCHIVLSGKRNITGVEDKTDMSADYDKFEEILPFTVKTNPCISLNNEDAPWLWPKKRS
jgi:hypothetical protein